MHFFLLLICPKRLGFDFWGLTTPSGKSLKNSFEVLKPYLIKDKEWKGEQIKEFNYEEGYDILMNAADILNVKIAFMK